MAQGWVSCSAEMMAEITGGGQEWRFSIFIAAIAGQRVLQCQRLVDLAKVLLIQLEGKEASIAVPMIALAQPRPDDHHRDRRLLHDPSGRDIRDREPMTIGNANKGFEQALKDRPAADEMVMVMNGYNTTFDGEGNQLYAVNGIPFHYMHEPVQVRRNELVRIYLVNILEFDPINSFHIHGNFFDYYPTGTRLQPTEYTDTIVQGQGQRGICELRFPYPGKYMFHSHKTEFADLGWMGFFEVSN